MGIENNTPPEGCPFDARPRLREDSNSLLQSCTSIDADARDFDEKTADVSGTLIQFQLFFSLTWRDLYRKMIPHPPPPRLFSFRPHRHHDDPRYHHYYNLNHQHRTD